MTAQHDTSFRANNTWVATVLSDSLEREDGGVLPISKHVDHGLAHEQPDRDTNGHSYHGIPDVYAISLRGDTSSLWQAWLQQI